MGNADKGLSRRNFIGGAAMVGLLSAGALAGCAPASKTQGGTLQTGAEEPTRSHELVIVGSGLAGLCAGIRARENGTDVLIVEKGSALGTPSNSILSGGALCTPNDESEESVQTFIEVLETKSKGKGHPEISRLIAENITKDLDWLRSHGAQIEDPTPHLPFDCLKLYFSPGASQGMGILMQTLSDEYEANGGESLCDTKLLDFVFDTQGKVAGIKVRGKEGVETIAAGAVILASGGYVANKQMLEQYVGPDADEIMVRGSTSITGDGLLAAERAGAMLCQMGGDASLHIGAVSPENVGSGNPSNALGYCLSINSQGKRYTDESRGYVSHGKALMNQPDQVAALVFDEETKKLDKVQQDIERFQSFNSAPLEAQSLEELADLIKVPASALVATVEEFNAAVDGETTHGLAVDKAAMARKVESSKYYAFYPLKPGSIMGFGGIYTNENMQALEPDGTPISGLYVIGEAIGGVFMYDYIAGASLDRCIVSGIVAADRVASGK